MAFKLTQVDITAIVRDDDVFINQAGVDAYKKQNYKSAKEYYCLGAILGNVDSICNLGYCYMYGRGIEKNIDLAIEYFKIAARFNNVDALSKLGNIYANGINGVKKDEDMGLYYYRSAIYQIAKQHLDPERYPSLYYAVGKELMEGKILDNDLDTAFSYLMIAFMGYDIEIANGAHYYIEVQKDIKALLDNPCFNEIKKMMKELDEEEYGVYVD